MGAALRESSGQFVGQVLGRPSPVLEFKAALPLGDNALVEMPMSNANANAKEQPYPSESEVRVTHRASPPRLPFPVLPRLVRHTDSGFTIDAESIALVAPQNTARRLIERAAYLALSTGAVLAIFAAVAGGARAATGSQGHVVTSAKPAAHAPHMKHARVQQHLDAHGGHDAMTASHEQPQTTPHATATTAHPHQASNARGSRGAVHAHAVRTTPAHAAQHGQAVHHAPRKAK